MKSLGKLKTAHLLILPFLSFLTTKYNPYPFIISYHLNIEKITATETRLIPEHNHFLYSDFFFKTCRVRTEMPMLSTTSLEYDCHIFLKYLVCQMKNLVFQSNCLLFRTLDFDRNTRCFKSEILKY